MTGVTPLPRPPLPEDPIERLKVLVTEYGAAGNRERNYRSCMFAHQFWWCLTEVLPAIEERHAKVSAERLRQFKEILDRADLPDPPPRLARHRRGLRAVKDR